MGENVSGDGGNTDETSTSGLARFQYGGFKKSGSCM